LDAREELSGRGRTLLSLAEETVTETMDAVHPLQIEFHQSWRDLASSWSAQKTLRIDHSQRLVLDKGADTVDPAMRGSYSYDAVRSRDDYGGGLFTLGRKHASLRETAVFCLLRQEYVLEKYTYKRIRVAITRQPSVGAADVPLAQVVAIEEEQCDDSVDIEVAEPGDGGLEWGPEGCHADPSSTLHNLQLDHAAWWHLPGGIAVSCTTTESQVLWWRDESCRQLMFAGRGHDHTAETKAWFHQHAH